MLAGEMPVLVSLGRHAITLAKAAVDAGVFQIKFQSQCLPPGEPHDVTLRFEADLRQLVQRYGDALQVIARQRNKSE